MCKTRTSAKLGLVRIHNPCQRHPPNMLISNPINSHSQEDLGGAMRPRNERPVVSCTRGNKWSSAFDKWLYPLQNCWLNVLKQDVDELTATHFIVRMQFDPDIFLQPAPGFDSVYPQWCRPRKFPGLWTLSENSKGYQHLWNSEKKKFICWAKLQWDETSGTKSAGRVPAMITTHLFLLLLWGWKLYTQYWGSLCSPLDYTGTRGCLRPI